MFLFIESTWYNLLDDKFQKMHYFSSFFFCYSTMHLWKTLSSFLPPFLHLVIRHTQVQFWTKKVPIFLNNNMQ